MQSPANPAQPEENLEFLLDYVACPLDNSAPLTPVRNSEGQVVSLRSKAREYPVINNIPCLLPDLGERGRGDLALWQAHQAKMWREYQDGDEGVFSGEDDLLARCVGEVVNQAGGGLYLDVGCGAMPRPAYMAASSESTTWIGVDPFFGDVVRRFPFAQAMAEYLPFRSQAFDGILYASSIYHLLDPLRSLRRASNIIQPHGKLLVWYTAGAVDPRYIVWRMLRGLGIARRYSQNYQWAFTHGSLRSLLRRAGFAMEEDVFLCKYCPDYRGCKDPREFLVVATCI